MCRLFVSFSFDCERILNAVRCARLPEIANLDLRTYRSAWEPTRSERLNAVVSDSASKTCFVYLANAGWHWRPYPEPEPKVGAIAQQITGQIGVQYEEIPCDIELPLSFRLLELLQ